MTIKRLKRRGVILLFAAIFAASGCSSVSSTAKRSGRVALGAAIGGGSGYVLGDKSPGAIVGGATAGALLTQLSLGEDADARQAGFDQGYVQGQSDAIKRQYFLRQAMEQQPLPVANSGGEAVYYVLPGPELTSDGRKLAPHTVAVRVIE